MSIHNAVEEEKPSTYNLHFISRERYHRMLNLEISCLILMFAVDYEVAVHFPPTSQKNCFSTYSLGNKYTSKKEKLIATVPPAK